MHACMHVCMYACVSLYVYILDSKAIYLYTDIDRDIGRNAEK